MPAYPSLSREKSWNKVKLPREQRCSKRHSVSVTTNSDLGQSLYQAVLNTLINKTKVPPLSHVFYTFCLQ